MNSNRALQTWIPRILVVNFILILAVDLFPFDYDFSTGWSWDEITQSFTSDTIQGLEGSTEVLMALLLYLPFGFCVAGWLYLKGFKPWGQLAIAGLICGLIALLGETLQEFSPSRHANFSDVLSSIVWATVGIIGFVGLRSPILRGALFLGQFLKRWLSAPQIIASFMGYFALVLIVSWTLQQSFLLSNWETDYPLIMGNERTADRPWQGQITELCFADQAIPQPELTPWIAPEGCPQVRDSLFTRYQFDQGSPYSDQQGNSPELIWSGATPVRTQPEQRGVMIDSQHWLTTAEPMANLSEQLRQTSQFTVGLTVATAQLNQDGPARMVSISNGPFERNLTLGQNNQDLILRLRTPITQENGLRPQFVIPGVFADQEFHRVVVAYDPQQMRVYLDTLDNFLNLQFTPANNLFMLFSSIAERPVNLTILPAKLYQGLYYLLVFIPLGFLAGLLAVQIPQSRLAYLVLIGVGLGIPALILQWLFFWGDAGTVGQHLSLSLGIGTLALGLTRLRLASGLKLGRTD